MMYAEAPDNSWTVTDQRAWTVTGPVPWTVTHHGLKVRGQQIQLSHKVRAGQTLGGIARLYHTTVGRLADLNGIANPDMIQVSQVIQLP